MPAKTLLAILFVISVAVATLVVVRALPNKPEVVQSAVPGREVLVAAVPLAAGTLLRAEDVRWWSPPNDAQFAGEILRPAADKREAKPESDEEARAEVRGAALRTNLAAGAPVLRGDLVKPGDRDFLRVVLVSGARAVAVPIPVGSGLLYAGDRVDVILTQTFRTDGPASRRSVSETIAEDLRVLAVDWSKTDGSARAITLEVSGEQAERLNVATELGKLALILRGGLARGGNTSQTATDGSHKPTWAGDVSGALSGPPPTPAPLSPAERPTINVLHGTKNAETLKQD